MQVQNTVEDVGIQTEQVEFKEKKETCSQTSIETADYSVQVLPETCDVSVQIYRVQKVRSTQTKAPQQVQLRNVSTQTLPRRLQSMSGLSSSESSKVRFDQNHMSNKGRFCNNSQIDTLISKWLSVENKAKLSQLTRADL